MKSKLLLAATLAIALASPAWAHHSAAAFDRTRPIIVAGTVKEFRWANPHSWIQLMVPDGKGGMEQWSLEGASVSVLARNGWTSASIKPGEKIKALVAPRRDGANGGEFLSVTLADGKVLTFGLI